MFEQDNRNFIGKLSKSQRLYKSNCMAFKKRQNYGDLNNSNNNNNKNFQELLRQGLLDETEGTFSATLPLYIQYNATIHFFQQIKSEALGGHGCICLLL